MTTPQDIQGSRPGRYVSDYGTCPCEQCHHRGLTTRELGRRQILRHVKRFGVYIPQEESEEQLDEQDDATGGADRDHTPREAEVISNFEALAKHIEDLGFGKNLRRDDDGESSSGDDSGDEEGGGEEDEDAEDLTDDSADDSDGEDDVVSAVFRMWYPLGTLWGPMGPGWGTGIGPVHTASYFSSSECCLQVEVPTWDLCGTHVGPIGDRSRTHIAP
jgi:hypothetical protein